MKSLWDDAEARQFQNSALDLRVYTSRLLGREPSLVLHGGGNTSVKTTIKDMFGEPADVLYVKGSGWDLATIEARGFAPVRMEALLKMAQLEELSDVDMVKAQRVAMLDPGAPNPSVETILHALIPFTYVDHSHADAVVIVSNTSNGEERIRELYGDRVLIIPYVMPGVVLAKAICQETRDVDWSRYEGMVLMNHGLFTFSDSARESYERTVRLVTEAEHYIHARIDNNANEADYNDVDPDLHAIARLRARLCVAMGGPVIVRTETSVEAQSFAARDDIATVATRGPLTPDHVIRTKRIPVILNPDNLTESVDKFVSEYEQYFQRNTDGNMTMLDPAPRWAVWPGIGTLTFGRSIKDANINRDIVRHTVQAIKTAEQLDTWQALDEKSIFDMEYWELEQAKLKKGAAVASPWLGKVVLVTGAASGIGKACADSFRAAGACVALLDIDAAILEQTNDFGLAGLVCDVTDAGQVRSAMENVVRLWGGIDVVVLNAGIFPPSITLEDMDDAVWQRSIDINLTGARRVVSASVPYLRHGIDPAIVVIGSKNVPAPGPGVSAYSVAKAGLNQLARVAALELASYGIRVNIVHPNGVFDTGIWNDDILASRAKHYGITVEEYKTNNLLRTEVTSSSVADMVIAMAGRLFGNTTGAQVPIDGGNERVI